MGKLDTIGLILHGVCEELNLSCCMMSMGVRNNRGNQQRHGSVMMGGRAWRSKGKCPKISGHIFLALLNNSTVISHREKFLIKCNLTSRFSQDTYAKQ